MPAKKIMSFQDYPFNTSSSDVDITMKELNISRDEAVEIMKKLLYRLHYPKKKKRKVAGSINTKPVEKK